MGKQTINQMVPTPARASFLNGRWTAWVLVDGSVHELDSFATRDAALAAAGRYNESRNATADLAETYEPGQ